MFSHPEASLAARQPKRQRIRHEPWGRWYYHASSKAREDSLGAFFTSSSLLPFTLAWARTGRWLTYICSRRRLARQWAAAAEM